MLGPRGFLANYPPDVVLVSNGRPITKGDILNAKRRKQVRRLEHIRANYEPVTKPCFVWVFHVPGFLFHGWHLYVKTLKKDWCINLRNADGNEKMALKIMSLFPCGYSPEIENFSDWKVMFAQEYHYPTRKRPCDQGMALARAVYEPGSDRLLDVQAATTQENL